MATKKEDIRITKTKKALTAAFFELLSTTALSDVTVNDLCEKADVRRATFYKHFNDKNDFVMYLIKSVRTNFDGRITDQTLTLEEAKAYFIKCSEAIINYLLKHEKSLKNFITSDMQPTFIEMFVKQNYEDTVNILNCSIEEGMFAPVDQIASMLIGGVSHCIVHWFGSSDRCSVEELVESISNFVLKVLS